MTSSTFLFPEKPRAESPAARDPESRLARTGAPVTTAFSAGMPAAAASKEKQIFSALGRQSLLASPGV